MRSCLRRRARLLVGAVRGAALLLLSVLVMPGCASDYVARMASARQAYELGLPDAALAILDAEEQSAPARDRLLLLMDRGMMLHAAGRWEESIRVLAEAERSSEQLEVVSISEEATTLLSTERTKAYRGEDFEKLMISVLQALNYAQLGKDEDALVEVRRVNERLEQMVVEEKKPYEQLAIARYLGGVLYEDQGEWDSALIDYRKALELQPKLGALAEPLLRLAKQTGREELYEQLRQALPDVPHAPLAPDEGQLLVVVEAGLAPEKQPDRRSRSSYSRLGGGTSLERQLAEDTSLIEVPAFRDRWPRSVARVQVGEGAAQEAVTVTSLEEVAQVHLEDRVGRMVLKQLGGVALKAGVAAGAGALARDEAVGALTFVVLSALNAPDLRSWMSLPAEFQLVRLRLPRGQHTVRVEAGGKRTEHAVQVQPRRTTLLVLRRF